MSISTQLLRSSAVALVLVFVAAVLVLAADSQPKPLTIEGYVIDSACTFTKNLDKPVSRECAVSCAKAGSPLVILTDDGTIYWPIADTMPATGQNARLLEFAGSRVKVKGKAYEHGGAHALIIEEIQSAPPKK